MAVKISQLPAASAATAAQELEVNTSGTSEKITGEQLSDFVIGEIAATDIQGLGALMDSELTDLASVKAIDQGLATTDTPTFSGVNTTTINGNGYPSAGALGNRNKIINGAMVIDQRNSGSSVTPTTSTYTLDRWLAIASLTSKFSVQQNAGSVTPPDGFPTYLGVTSLSAYSVASTETFAISQRIEGYNIADLGWGTSSAKAITISVWVRSSLTGTFGGALRNSANDRSYPFTYTISAANTWEYKTINIAGDTSGTWLTNNGAGLEIIFGLGSGSTRSGTAGAWAGVNYTNATGATSVVGTNGATLYITGVQLEVGDTATPFEHRSYGQELALCQRYYQRDLYNSLLPLNAGSTLRRDYVRLQTPMRSTPSVSFDDANGNDSKFYRNGVNRAGDFATITNTFLLSNSSDGVASSIDDLYFVYRADAEL